MRKEQIDYLSQLIGEHIRKKTPTVRFGGRDGTSFIFYQTGFLCTNYSPNIIIE